MAFPGCVAVMVHEPGVSNVIWKPLTVQTGRVLDVRVTVRPEFDVAVAVTGVWSIVLLPGLVNVIDWLTLLTVKARVTGAAAAYVPLPGCVAVMEQVPAPTRVIWKPLTVQTASVVDVSVTVSPEEAVADAVTGVWSMVLALMFANVIVCGSGTAGVTAFEGVDAGPVPAMFVALSLIHI